MSYITKLDSVTLEPSNYIIFAEYKTFDSEKFISGKLRVPFYPGQDVSYADIEIQSIATALWTQDVITAYQSMINDAATL